MPFLSHIEIKDFRNLSEVKLTFSKKFNILYGENGSGKTSFLEAIYHLGFGKSFRTSLYNRVIQEEKERFSIFGKVYCDSPVGVERHRSGDLKIRFSGETIKSSSELARIFPPIQLIGPDSYQLLNAGPKIRRQFIDWGMFHVEHSLFLEDWRKLLRVLKQRNAALKQYQEGKGSKHGILLWDEDFIDISKSINNQRKAYFTIYKTFLSEIFTHLLERNDLRVNFYPGWNQDHQFKDILLNSLGNDVQRGYTQFGPHRADLKLYIGKMPAREVLSRGQQKLLVCAMQLAQALVLWEKKQSPTLFLIDDLPSELDEARREALAIYLSKMDGQVFVTGIDPRTFDGLFKAGETEMFHVEHGSISSAMFHVEH